MKREAKVKIVKIYLTIISIAAVLFLIRGLIWLIRITINTLGGFSVFLSLLLYILLPILFLGSVAWADHIVKSNREEKSEEKHIRNQE